MMTSVGAGAKDVMLVLDIGGDNYHVLQGKDIDGILTNEIIGSMLDTTLEPYFSKKDYGAGAAATANAFYSFFLARAESAQGTVANGQGGAMAASSEEKGKAGTGTIVTLASVFIGLVAIVGISTTRRNKYLGLYGVPFNPYSRRSVRRYGIWQGQADYGNGRRWQGRYHNHRHAEPRHTQSSSFWGNTGGVGRH